MYLEVNENIILAVVKKKKKEIHFKKTRQFYDSAECNTPFSF